MTPKLRRWTLDRYCPCCELREEEIVGEPVLVRHADLGPVEAALEGAVEILDAIDMGAPVHGYAAKAEQARQQKPRTMQSIYDDSTVRLYGGHLAWTGPKKVHFKGQQFTPKQFCFVLARGHNSDGPVRSECGNDECVLPAHLADTTERARCGTRPGYHRHRRNGQTPCAPCRQANTDADNRLRRTGTSRVAV